MKNSSNLFASLIILIIISGCDTAQETTENNGNRALSLVKQWVAGSYNNVAQADADVAADLQPELMHRPMHQLFVPIDAPNIAGYVVFQQSSMDGSENPAMIFRHGLMQYFLDNESGKLRQRELYFKDPEPYKNLHRNPALLKDVPLDALTWDEGCDFYLDANADGTMVSGPLLAGACVLFNQGLQKNMYADDVVEITADEYRFRGRYVDAEGNTLWGTDSPELNKLVKQ